MLNTYNNTKEPDILEVISDLSNDEVFTPPSVAKQMLDLLPPDVWKNPSLRWIDPFTKTGVFLREITKRLLVGLEREIPDEQQRLEHILRKMVFGVAITELTSLMSRRSLYCAKWANSEKSVVKFPNKQGNLSYQRIEHEFFRGRCSECKAPASIFDVESMENYAYALLHQEGRRFIEKEIGLKFDIVVGNPPYQMDADAAGQNVIPLYDLFVGQAKALSPDHIVMVIPSRWMAGGKGLANFRAEMLADERIRSLVDFPNAAEVFPGIGSSIRGGVCYFHWDREHSGGTKTLLLREGQTIDSAIRSLAEFDVLIRDSRALSILRKVQAHNEPSFSEIVSTRDPFGPQLSSNFKKYLEDIAENSHHPALFMNVKSKREKKRVDAAFVTRNKELIDTWKVLYPVGGSDGGQKLPDPVIGLPFIAEPHSVCTLTYLVVGPLSSKTQADSVLSYMKTRFVRFLVALRKISQHSTQSTFSWVPSQIWSHEFEDEQLFAKYKLTPEEIQLICDSVTEMP